MNTAIDLCQRYPPTVPVIATVSWWPGDEWAVLSYRTHGAAPWFAGFVHLGAEFAFRGFAGREPSMVGIERSVAFDAAVPITGGGR